MNRQDWEFVGVRLLGVYFMVVGVASLPGMLAPGFSTHWSLVLPPILYLLAGLLLAIETNRVRCWLGDRGRSR